MPKKPSKKALHVVFRSALFPESGWFNQARIERLQEGILLHLGFFTDQGLLYNFSVFLEPGVLEITKDSSLMFLDRIGGVQADPLPAWRGSIEVKGAKAANVISLSATTEVGELRFGIFAHGEAVEFARAGTIEDLAANPIALLHCSKEMLRQLVTNLYT